MTILPFQTFKIHLCEFVWRKMNKYEKVENYKLFLSENRAVLAETARQAIREAIR